MIRALAPEPCAVVLIQDKRRNTDFERTLCSATSSESTELRGKLVDSLCSCFVYGQLVRRECGTVLPQRLVRRCTHRSHSSRFVI